MTFGRALALAAALTVATLSGACTKQSQAPEPAGQAAASAPVQAAPPSASPAAPAASDAATTATSAADTATTVTTAAPVSEAIARLKLAAADNVAIRNELCFGAQYAEAPRYREMFGLPHLCLAQQIVEVDGAEGGVTFAEFADPDQAAAACRVAVDYFKARPRPALATVYGNVVVVVQAGNPDRAALAAFAGRITALLDRQAQP